MNYDHLIAGSIGGVTSALILHPFDLLKLRFAGIFFDSIIANDGFSHTLPSYNGILNAIVRIYKYDGNIKGLYRGVTPNIIGSGLAWGFYFFIYNTFKSWISIEDQKSKFVQSTLAALLSGFSTLVLTNPFWLIKTRLCLQTIDPSIQASKLPFYKGTVDAFTSIYRNEGVKGLYKGFVPGLFGISHGTIQFVAYDELKSNYLLRFLKKPIDTKLNNSEYLTIAALSKIFAVNLTYPFQVIKYRLQDRNKRYDGFKDAVHKIWKYLGLGKLFNAFACALLGLTRVIVWEEECCHLDRYEGFYGFYKGWWPQILRVTPSTCITFLVYENLIQYLSEL